MTHTYFVTGMTCSSCLAKVKGLLSKVSGVKNVHIDLAKAEALIDMEWHIPIADFKKALKDYPKYQLSESNYHHFAALPEENEETKSWLETYKPILLIFGYITGITLLTEWAQGEFLWIRWMNHFMAGFFLVFSFFKLLNLRGFAESYCMYDIIAKKWNGWGYVYAFAELALGIVFLTGIHPILTNIVTFVIMTVSIVGVLQSVLNKKKIKCACLGDVFNLPMSSITIIEDALMIGMSGITLATMF
ncbi:MAG: cation transporter [Sphingobacteriia bacterium]|jgi:copper chaperone CopZ|nr:cation transporter [Sphingobacteriia bacterium]